MLWVGVGKKPTAKTRRGETSQLPVRRSCCHVGVASATASCQSSLQTSQCEAVSSTMRTSIMKGYLAVLEWDVCVKGKWKGSFSVLAALCAIDFPLPFPLPLPFMYSSNFGRKNLWNASGSGIFFVERYTVTLPFSGEKCAHRMYSAESLCTQSKLCREKLSPGEHKIVP